MANLARWVFNLLFTLIPVILLGVFFVSISAFLRDLNEYRTRQTQAAEARLEAVRLRAAGNVNAQTLEQTRKILTQRLQNVGVRGFRIEIQNNLVTVRLPELEAAQRNRVNALLTQRGNLALQLVKTSAGNRSIAQLRPTDLEPPALTNRDLNRVQAGQGESGRPGLTLRLNREGAAKFARLTAAHVGRRVAIVVDGRILIAPTIRGSITGGMVSIQGFSSQQVVERLADLLQTDPLPVRLELVKSQ
jgi:preprotein translocase subunit SecD